MVQMCVIKRQIVLWATAFISQYAKLNWIRRIEIQIKKSRRHRYIFEATPWNVPSVLWTSKEYASCLTERLVSNQKQSKLDRISSAEFFLGRLIFLFSTLTRTSSSSSLSIQPARELSIFTVKTVHFQYFFLNYWCWFELKLKKISRKRRKIDEKWLEFRINQHFIQKSLFFIQWIESSLKSAPRPIKKSKTKHYTDTLHWLKTKKYYERELLCIIWMCLFAHFVSICVF